MSITVFIRYQLDPFQREAFEAYAKRWLVIIPKCGGNVVGYWMPHEGTNNIAYGLISFPSLADYEVYRARLRSDREGAANFVWRRRSGSFWPRSARSCVRSNEELMPSLDSMVIVALTFLLAGSVKGVTGLGLPSVSLALLTAALGLKAAMAILILPSFVTNVWQAAVGGYLLTILRRTWSLLLAVCVATWLGVGILARANAGVLAGVLGVILCIYAVLGLTRVKLASPGRLEPWLSPIVGAVSGLLNGMTGSFVVPGVLYLQALQFPRDGFIQAMGVLFTTSTVALALALQDQNLLSRELVILSVGAILPALIGMVLGQMVRRRLPDEIFARVFFFALFILGAYIVLRAASAL